MMSLNRRDVRVWQSDTVERTAGLSMLESVWNFFAKWGDTASVVGLFVSLIGFGLTIYGVRKAKSAAEKAKETAAEVKEKFHAFDTVATLSQALAVLMEIIRLQRAGAWPVLPDRYLTLRGLLITLRGSHDGFSEEHLAVFTSTIQHVKDIQDKVEKSLTESKTPTKIATTIQILSDQFEKLTEIITALRKRSVEYNASAPEARRITKETDMENGNNSDTLGKDNFPG